MVLEKFKLYLTLQLINLKNLFSNKNNYKPLIICDAGIGDLILSTPLILKLYNKTGNKIDIITNKKSINIINNNPHIGDIFLVEDYIKCRNTFLSIINNNNYSIVYSVRTNINLLFDYGLLGRNKYWIANPIYEELRLISRFLGFFCQRYKKKFYSKSHTIDILCNMLDNCTHNTNSKIQIFTSEEDNIFIKQLTKNNIEYAVIHVGGADNIRKIKSKVLIDLINRISIKCYLVGGNEDIENANKILTLTNNAKSLVGVLSLRQTYALIKRASVCIAPDSSVMHLASATEVPLVALMGNALEETFGPRGSIDVIKVLSRKPKCSPCSKTECNIFNGHSCVQDINAYEIINTIRDFDPLLVK